MDIEALGKITRENALKDIDAWFPPEYSKRSDLIRLEQRRTACKNFIFGPLRTEDVQERSVNPVKPVPRLPYLECFVDVLISEHNLIVPKVRRMIQTLTVEAYELWRVIERAGTKVALVQASGADGEKHVEEDIKGVMWFNLPQDLRDQFQLADAQGQFKLIEKRRTSVSGKPRWERWASQIIAAPSNSRELIGWGASSIFWDEFCTHPGARRACKAIMPTLFGRTKDKGQMIRMGTVNPETGSGRYFMELYERDNLKRARMTAKYGIEYSEGQAL